RESTGSRAAGMARRGDNPSAGALHRGSRERRCRRTRGACTASRGTDQSRAGRARPVAGRWVRRTATPHPPRTGRGPYAPTLEHPGDRMTTNRLKHIQPRIAPTVNARVVTLDIERIPGRARVKHRGLTIEGEFWDLNG